MKAAAIISATPISEPMTKPTPPESNTPPITAAAIASSKIKPEYEFRNGKKVLVGYSQEVRFWDKNAALEKLMKYLGMFAKDNQQRSSDAIAALLAAIDGKSARLTVSEGESEAVRNRSRLV